MKINHPLQNPEVAAPLPVREVTRLSLITTSRGRVGELRQFLESVQAQNFQCLEIILVDQTSGIELDEVLAPFQGTLSISRVPVAPCGISAARNEGLKHIRGDVVAFPDDDCRYPPGLLDQVFQTLEKSEETDGLSCLVCDEQGAPSAGGVMQKEECTLSFSNLSRRSLMKAKADVWKTAVSCSFFIRRATVEAVGGFDEQLGVGAESGCWSGEETDWLLRALGQGACLLYRPDLKVFHPQPDFTAPGGFHKAFRYGCGAGHVLRKHHYSGWFIAASAGFQLVRSFRELLRLRPRAAAVRLATAAGRLKRS